MRDCRSSRDSQATRCAPSKRAFFGNLQPVSGLFVEPAHFISAFISAGGSLNGFRSRRATRRDRRRSPKTECGRVPVAGPAAFLTRRYAECDRYELRGLRVRPGEVRDCPWRRQACSRKQIRASFGPLEGQKPYSVTLQTGQNARKVATMPNSPNSPCEERRTKSGSLRQDRKQSDPIQGMDIGSGTTQWQGINKTNRKKPPPGWGRY